MIRCLICEKDLFKKWGIWPISVYSQKVYGLVQCANCLTIFTNPLPSEEEINRIYKESYFYDAHRVTLGEKKYRARKMAQYIGKFGGVKAALDIGAMYGFLVEELNKTSIDCVGIEIDPEAVAYCEKNKIPVENSSLEKYLENSDGKQQDLIILSHVLEHLFDPKEKLLSLKDKLSEGGKILIAVPNIEAVTRRLFGKFWGYWDVPVHITHFQEDSLRYLLESSGFEIMDVKKVGGSSLVFFSTLAKLFGKSGSAFELSKSKKGLIRGISSVLKYWYNLGNDEIFIVAKKRHPGKI